VFQRPTTGSAAEATAARAISGTAIRPASRVLRMFSSLGLVRQPRRAWSTYTSIRLRTDDRRRPSRRRFRWRSETGAAAVAGQVVVDDPQLVGHDPAGPGRAVGVVLDLVVDHRLAGRLGLVHEPLGLFDRHGLVAVAVVDHQRDLHLLGLVQRAQAVDRRRLGLAEEGVGVEARPDAADVGHAGAGDGALVQAVRAHRGGERGVTAVGEAEHGDVAGLGQALVDQPLGAVVLVILHLAAPLGVAGHPQLAAP